MIRTATFSIVLAFFPVLNYAQTSRLSGPPGETRVRLQGQVNPLAVAANDAGPVDVSTVLRNVTLSFAPTDAQQAELDALLVAQQTPGAPEYHRWLTPDEYADRFGVSATDISTVKAWLETQGLNVTAVARSRTWISISGTAGQVNAAFQTELRRYRVNGETHFANATAPAIPAEFSGLVRGIRGLNDFRMRPRLHVMRNPAPGTAANPNPKYTSSRGNHYIAPADLAILYNFAPLYSAGLDGTGQKIVVAGQTAIRLGDIQQFRSEYGLAANDPQTLLVPGSSDPGVVKDDIDEANLDIEWSGASARNATIVYVYATDVMNAVQYAIDQNLAPVISTSYGSCEPVNSSREAATLRSWAQQANAQGITWFAASGDTGGADCSSNGNSALAVDLPGSIPEVTSVGGTEFQEGAGTYWMSTNGANSGSVTGYIPETSWNDSAIDGEPSASGGGASQYFAKPAWQNVPGVPGDNARHVPDVSMNASADHDGYLVYSSGDYVFGGTSVPTPIYAGLAALLNQNAIALGKGAGLGNVNPALYAVSQSTPSAFHDITTGDNIVSVACSGRRICNTSPAGYSAGPGYDQVTGLGSVDAYQLVTNWYGPAAPPVTNSRIVLQSNVPLLAATDTLFVTATVTLSDGSTPTGSVTFSQAGSQLGVVQLSGSAGVATATLAVAAAKLQQGAGSVTAIWNSQNAALPITVVGSAGTGAIPAISSVTNAASFTPAYAPGAIVSLFGSQLAPAAQAAVATPLPVGLSGVAATVNGIAAPLWYVSETQVNLQIPYEVPSGSTATVVLNNNGKTGAVTLPIGAAAPGIFTDASNNLTPVATAARGQTIAMYITGAGAVTPAIATGAAPSASTLATALPRPTQSTVVTVGGVPAAISFAGIPAGVVGVVQLNVQIPSTVAQGSQPVVVTIGSVASRAAMLQVTP